LTAGAQSCIFAAGKGGTIMKLTGAAAAALAATLALSACGRDERAGPAAADVREYAIAYPKRTEPPRNSCDPMKPGEMVHSGSTHEITFDHKRPGDLWLTGQNYDWLVRVTPATGDRRFVYMGSGTGPHGIEYGPDGLLWVSLECSGRVVALDRAGTTVRDWPLPAGTRPHGLGIGPDGAIWYTGKTTGRIGRVDPATGAIIQYALTDPTSTPIYVKAGPDGSMWATELTGNRIARITPAGKLFEYEIPFRNSRPIAIVPGPDGAMWFSEEAGSRVGRIDERGRITEFAVPKPAGRPNMLLADLAFDDRGDLWVQQYVDQGGPGPSGEDYVVRIAAAGLEAGPDRLEAAHFTRYPVKTRNTVMHRIIQGPDKAMWFTEMHADKVGRLAVKRD
jgi:virginiamycin B lyase